MYLALLLRLSETTSWWQRFMLRREARALHNLGVCPLDWRVM
jgi:hypothetical protein